MEKRYQVFISSTFADLEDERKGVMEAIIELNCFPAGMEMFPASNKEQFDYIKSVIDESDYYVIIIAGRYGSIAEDGISYTEKEFDYAKEKGIPILAFVKKNIACLPADKIELDPKNRERLEHFREKTLNGRLAKFWDTKDELKYNLHSSLSQEMKVNPKIGWIRGNTVSDVDLYDKLEQLRNECGKYKKLYAELKNKLGVENNRIQDEQQLEFEKRIKSPFDIAFYECDGYEATVSINIVKVIEIAGIVLFTQWTAKTLKDSIESFYAIENQELTLSLPSLSSILLKLLALEIIEPIGDILEDEIELTPTGKNIVLSLVSF